LLHKYVYGEVPPLGEEVADPSLPPLVETLVVEVIVALRAVGSVKVTLSTKVHPLLSVTVTVNVPAVKFVGF